MSTSRVARLRLEAEAAEREATTARAQLAAGGGDLTERVRERWIPRALVGAGAMFGYWIEGHLNRGSTRSDDAHGEKAHAGEEQSSSAAQSVTPSSIAGWLGLAMSALRLVETLRPLVERTMAQSDASKDSVGDAPSAAGERETTTQGESGKTPDSDAQAVPQNNAGPRAHVEAQR